MDPYFKPILVSGSLLLLANTFLTLPFLDPFFKYIFICIFAGFLAVYLFSKEIKRELKVLDSALLGFGAGILAGSIQSLITAYVLQNQKVQELIIKMINEQMQMHSFGEFRNLSAIEPAYIVGAAVFTILISSVSCFLGALMALPLLHKKKL
jgi:hypothetical protein